MRSALEDTATASNPDIYVNSASFHIVSFFVVFGLPLLFLLALIMFVVTKMTNKPDAGAADELPDSSEDP